MIGRPRTYEGVKNDIYETRKLLHQREYKRGFTSHSSCFLFTTENQNGINDIIDYKGKHILTPSASGDQYLGAVYYDAREIDLFDINRLTYYIACLKIAAVIVLDYQEFMDFLTPLDKYGRIKPSFWNLKTLKRLLKVMPSYVAYYWDNVMFEARKNGYNWLICPNHHTNEPLNIMAGMPFYSEEAEYYKLQAKLRARTYPHFIESDVLELKEKLVSMYDIIYLSNMLECIVYYRSEMDPWWPENETEKEVVYDVLEQVMPSLNEDGTVLVTYRPNRNLDTSDDWLFNNEFFDVDLIHSKFPPDHEDFPRIENTDMVLTYRPKRTGNILEKLY